MKRLVLEVIKIAATIKDVAKYTGLSIATVSKYINGGNVLEKNKILIENAIKELNFKVNEMARGLKTNKTMTVGVLIPSLVNIFSTTIVCNIEDILLKHGYSTIVCDCKENEKLEKDKLDFLINKMVDGIIIMPSATDTGHIKKAVENDIPVVVLDRLLKDLTCDTVLVDNLNASYTAVEKLIMRGHKRIGIICGPKDVYTSEERLKGYLRVHEDYGMDVDENLIKFGNYQIESGYSLLVELMNSSQPPTAIFVTNYEMTLGSIMAINEKNIEVPSQLSIIGFDNLQLAKVVKPSLSMVMQPMAEIGETAANLILKRLNDDKSNFPLIYRLKSKVSIKDSVKNLL